MVGLALGCAATRQGTAPVARETGTDSAASSSGDEAIAAFYRGKTVRIVVGTSPGGGYDTYARAMARHMSRYFPGSPNVIVENMPGAGSMLAMNNLYNTLPRDGTVFAHFAGGNLLLQILGHQAAQYESRRFTFIGAPTPETVVCVARRDAGVPSLASLRGGSPSLTMGGLAPGSTTDNPVAILEKGLGLSLKLVSGYPGTSDIKLAVARNEVQGVCAGWESLSVTWADLLQPGTPETVVPLGQAGDKPLADLPDVPLLRSLAQNDEQRTMVEVGLDAQAVMNRTFAAPPDVPADRAAALRRAFGGVLADPEFRADAAKAKLAVAPVSGEQIEGLVARMYEMSPPVKASLQALLLAQ